MTGSILRSCQECGARFDISAEERAFLEQLATERGWTEFRLPANCPPCRSARRAARYTVQPGQPDEWRRCFECGVDFEFGGRDRDYFAARGWLAPNRCRDCRRSRASR